MKYILIVLVSIPSFLYAGVIRHDVAEEEYIKLAQEQQFDCVGQIIKYDSIKSASCILISPKYILTAAHTLIESDSKPETRYINGTKVTVYPRHNHRLMKAENLSFEFKDKIVNAKRIILFPNRADSIKLNKYDVALVELEENVTNIDPATLNKNFDEINSEVVGVGFGVTGPGDDPTVKKRGQKIAGQNVVDSIGGYFNNEKPAIMYFDFDHPTLDDCNKLGSPEPLPLEYLAMGGDSGGGLFREGQNGWELIGICTGTITSIEQLKKTAYYCQGMNFTRVSVFIDWIEKEIYHK